jgi:hypothetical protein
MVRLSIRLPGQRPLLGGAATALLLSGLGLLGGCSQADRIGPLFGSDIPGDGSQTEVGFDPGQNGGVILHDLFRGARIGLTGPTITNVSPEDGARDISTRTLILVEFSESVLADNLQTSFNVFPQGSPTLVPGSTQVFQGQTVAVFIPQDELLPSTQYEVVVQSSIVDLQGKQLGGEAGSDQRFTFTTADANADLNLTVMGVSPAQNVGNVPRGTEVVILFSEPVTESGTAGILGPNNLLVRVNNVALTIGVDFTFELFPELQRSGLRVLFNNRLAANAEVEVEVGSNVESFDGEHVLLGGTGFIANFTTQDFQEPLAITAPTTPTLSESGFISSSNLLAHPTMVDLTDDPVAAEEVTLIYFDPGSINALVFAETAADPTAINANLQPEMSAALNDGNVVFGAYSERRGFRSDLSVFGSFRKDTVGPRLLEIGPPEQQVNGSPVFYSLVNDPVIYGRMDEPCSALSMDFDAAIPLDYDAVRFAPALATLTDDFFVTSVSQGGALTPQFASRPTVSLLVTDQFGNLSDNLDGFLVNTVGVVGASVDNSATPSVALVVTAFAGNSPGTSPVTPFQILGEAGSNTFGMVVIDEFPPQANPGGNQVSKGLAASGGIVTFTDTELAPILTAEMTVTIISDGFAPVTFAGLTKPLAMGSPLAVLPVLTPSPAGTQQGLVTAELMNQAISNAELILSAADADLDPSNEALESALVVDPGTDPVLSLSENQLQIVTAVEVVGAANFRFQTTEPLVANPPSGGGGSLTKSRIVDFQGTAQYSTLDDPTLVGPIEVVFDERNITSGDPSNVGMAGDSTTQFRRWRLISRLPGFPKNVTLVESDTFEQFEVMGVPVMGFLRSIVLSPISLSVNDPFGNSTVDDNPLELLLEPGLLDPNLPFDANATALRRNLRVEIHVEDRAAGQADPSGAFTRQRFLTNDLPGFPGNVVVFQSIPDFAANVADPNSVSYPPVFEWAENTDGEGVHRLNLVAGNNRVWQIYLPANGIGAVGCAPGNTCLQIPNITNLAVDTSPVAFEFAGAPSAGTNFRVFIESYDFDPGNQFASGDALVHEFSFQQFFQSDLEREHLKASRSDPQFRITTN